MITDKCVSEGYPLSLRKVYNIFITAYWRLSFPHKFRFRSTLGR